MPILPLKEKPTTGELNLLNNKNLNRAIAVCCNGFILS
jgi:hypothetical protein